MKKDLGKAARRQGGKKGAAHEQSREPDAILLPIRKQSTGALW